jgi:hypothetical protein
MVRPLKNMNGPAIFHILGNIKILNVFILIIFMVISVEQNHHLKNNIESLFPL